MENQKITNNFINKMRSKRREMLVRKKVTELPHEERTVVFLKFWEQLEDFEIAKSIGRTKSDVEKILQSAFARLKAQLLEASSDFDDSVEQVAA